LKEYCLYTLLTEKKMLAEAEGDSKENRLSTYSLKSGF